MRVTGLGGSQKSYGWPLSMPQSDYQAVSTWIGRDEHPDTLTTGTLNNPAITYIYQCRCYDAERLLVLLVALSKRVLGENSPLTLRRE